MSSAPSGSEGVFGGSPFGLLVASPHNETTLSFRKGPLEWLMGRATQLARRVH